MNYLNFTPRHVRQSHALVLAATAIALLAASTPSIAAPMDEALRSAIAAPHRSAANTARDAARHPLETLTFFEVRPDMAVVEISPGAGWYTEILAPYLREKGQLTVTAGDPLNADPAKRRGHERLKKKYDEAAAIYGKVKIGLFEPQQRFDYAAPASVDRVLTFRNVHNWAAEGDATVTAVFKSAYTALKPGGLFGVVDHRLPASRAFDPKFDNGYVHAAYVIKMAEGVGFKLAGSSEINANPKDTADHKNGVWALPPTYANKDENRAAYTAIGESDRLTLKFVKP